MKSRYCWGCRWQFCSGLAFPNVQCNTISALVANAIKAHACAIKRYLVSVLGKLH